jgi:WD40 repeat protein
MNKYEQHEVLGHGNSSVYRAIRLSDGVNVALKRVKGWSALEAEDQRVGLSEVAVLKTVEHPHAIKLLDSFTDKGDLCMVLPLVRPGTRVFEGSALPLTPAAVARVGYQLASAVAYLHGKTPQLLHRDIKPANLLLEAAPGVDLPPPGPLMPAQASALVCRGTLILGDFGSALALRRTLATGTVSGTPAYKASEILLEDEYAAPADVWSYGVTLLQLGTGHVVGGTSAARKTLMGRGAAQWTLQQALAGVYNDKFTRAGEEKAWVTACAAQKTAWAALGEPLQQLIESCLLVEAGGRAKASELIKHAAFEKERRAAFMAGAVGKLTDVSGSDGGGECSGLAVAAAACAALLASPLSALPTACSGVVLLLLFLLLFTGLYASQHWRLAAMLSRGGGGGGGGLKALTREELLAVLEAEEGVEEVVFGRACGQVEGLTAEGGVEDAWLKEICAALVGGMSGGVTRATPAARALKALHDGGSISAAAATVVAEVKKAVASGAGLVLGATVASGDEVARVSTENARQAAEIVRQAAENARLTAEIDKFKAHVCASPKVEVAPTAGGGWDGVQQAPGAAPTAGGPCPFCHKDPCTCTWLTGHCVKTLEHERGVWGLAVLEGGRLVSGGYGNTHLRVCDPATGVTVATMVGKGCKIAALPGGRFAAAGGDTKKAAVWDPTSPARPICEYTGHTGYVCSVASLPDNLVASGSDDKTVHIWKADTGAHVATLQGHSNYVYSLAVFPDGRLASGSWDNTVRLWDVSHPTSAPRVLKHGSVVNDLAVLDGGILASGCNDNKVYLWDVMSASDKPVALLEGHMNRVWSLAALPRGLLASGSADTTVRVWNVAARTCVAVLQGHTVGVWALAALPDGRLASGSGFKEGGVIMVWELLQRQADIKKKKKECVLQ